MPSKPALRTELLFYLSFLAAAALLVGVATMVVVNVLAPERTFVLLLLMVGLEVAVFVVFGRHLVDRLILWPLDHIVATADAVADGDLARRAPDAETSDFSMLAERLNRMTDHLLDAQGQLVRSEKLAGIGRLAAGIGHEVGNPLGARGAYGLLEAQGALRPARAALDLEPGIPHILGRPHLLEQAIVNLVLNAVDAAPGGIVILGGRPWDYQPHQPNPKRATDPAPARFPRATERRPVRPEFSSGLPGALVFVADSGPGVPPDDRDKVFDPFYTTKAPGRGTGLGLAIVARAVEDMGGVVWVDTAREGGAAFKMFFPRAGLTPRPPLHNVERGGAG